MIGEQLRNLKKQRKSVFHKLKVDFSFGNTEDMDDETILDLIPVETVYTGISSIHFDRFKLSREEEIKFNRKFSEYVKGLVQYINTPDIEYLFDYLCRKYYVHKFNAKEIIFALIPNEIFFGQIKKISRGSGFDYFARVKNYSTDYIADTCIRDRFFFDFFVEFYDFYEHVAEFVDEVTDKIINRADFDVNENLSQFYEIISKLYNSKNDRKIDHKRRACFLYQKVEKFIKADKKDFLDIFKENLCLEKINDINRTLNVNIKINKDLYEEFRETSLAHSGRKYLNDDKLLKDYLKYLYTNDILDSSFTKIELGLLFKIFLNNFKEETYKENRNEDVESIDASEYVNLAKDLKNKKKVLEHIVKFHKKDIHLFLKGLGIRDVILIVESVPDVAKDVINEENYKDIMNVCKDEDLELFKICFSFKNFEAMYFKLKNPFKTIIKLLDESREYVNIVKLLEHNQDFLEKDVFDEIINHMICFDLYKNPVFLDFLSKLDRRYDFYDFVIDHTEDYNSFTIMRLFMESDNIRHINEIVRYILKTKDYSEMFFSFTYRHREVINEVYLLDLLRENYYDKKLYDILKFYLIKNGCMSKDFNENTKMKVLVEDIYEKNSKTFRKLILDFDYELILRFLPLGDRVKYLITFESNSLEYFKYISKYLKEDENVVDVLLRNIEKLAYLSEIEEWNAIKIIILEGVNAKNNQIMFDVILNVLDVYCYKNEIINDYLDILEKICEYEIKIVENNKILDICKKLERNQKTRLIDLLVRKTDFEDIRIIPVVAKDMILERKSSVVTFIEKYQNVMSLYISDILMHYSDIYLSLLGLNTFSLIRGILCSYEYLKKNISEDHKEHIRNILLLLDNVLIHKKDIKDYPKLFDFVDKHKEEVNESNIYLLMKSYYKYCETKQVDDIKILSYLYESKAEVFFNISYKLCKYNVNVFDTYIKEIIDSIDPFSSLKFRLLHHYFKYKESLQSIDVSVLFNKLLDFYLNSKDLEIAKAISFLLNHDLPNILKYNAVILKNLKKPSILDTLRLLQILYSNTSKYNICLPKSTSHLALMNDCSDKEMKKETKKLLEIIENRFNVNPFVSND